MRHHTKTCCQVSHNRCQLVAVSFFFCQDPRCSFINVLVGTGDDIPNSFQSAWIVNCFHILVVSCQVVSYYCRQVCIKISHVGNKSWHLTTKILVYHSNRTVEQVSKVVGQFVVDTANIVFWCKGAVRANWQTTHEVISEWIQTVALY